MSDVTRRRFLEQTGLGLTAVVIGCEPTDDGTPGTDEHTTPTPPTPPIDDTDTTQASCEPTPKDIEGPFYVPGVPVRDELDLYGDTGPRLTVTGRALDAACLPIAGAVVEIWHVAPDG